MDDRISLAPLAPFDSSSPVSIVLVRKYMHSQAIYRVPQAPYMFFSSSIYEFFVTNLE
jgi:hypothetical protein